jgi:hypothetical protein
LQVKCTLYYLNVYLIFWQVFQQQAYYLVYPFKSIKKSMFLENHYQNSEKVVHTFHSCSFAGYKTEHYKNLSNDQLMNEFLNNLHQYSLSENTVPEEREILYYTGVFFSVIS